MSSQDLERNFEELNVEEIVKEAIVEAFDYDESLNIGKIENHCNQSIKEHYLKLADGDTVAQKRQDEMLRRFLDDKQF
ncbi:hypothetical protein [Helicobacter labetoulli]|uniref:hypothetical protein n=1 Tax=Helicobacter labetoulli TaxID=2315333 RepID=UPI000EF6789C|nr:hypothetical protein [Helicobacter labetoulli]